MPPNIYHTQVNHVQFVYNNPIQHNYIANISIMPDVLEIGSRRHCLVPVVENKISGGLKYIVGCVNGDIMFVVGCWLVDMRGSCRRSAIFVLMGLLLESLVRVLWS